MGMHEHRAAALYFCIPTKWKGDLQIFQRKTQSIPKLNLSHPILLSTEEKWNTQLTKIKQDLKHQKQHNQLKHTVRHSAVAGIRNSIVEDFWANAAPLQRWVAKTVFAHGVEMDTRIVIITMKPDRKNIDYTISYGDLDRWGLHPLGVLWITYK